MQKLRWPHALRIYHEELEANGHAVTYEPKLEQEARSEAAERDWWLNKSDEGKGETARTKGLLRAYLRAANGDNEPAVGNILPAQGIRILPRGRWHMDKWVIARATEQGWLTFEQKPEGMFEPAFLLTSTGLNWINS